jgi:hypothetical protein
MIGGCCSGCCGDVAGVFSDKKQASDTLKMVNRFSDTGLEYYVCKLTLDGPEGKWET